MMNVFWRTTLIVPNGRSLALLGMKRWSHLCVLQFLHQTKTRSTLQTGLYALAKTLRNGFGSSRKVKEIINTLSRPTGSEGSQTSKHGIFYKRKEKLQHVVRGSEKAESVFSFIYFRIEQQYQSVLTLWHETHVNMKSVVSWHYLVNEIDRIRASNVASVSINLHIILICPKMWGNLS